MLKEPSFPMILETLLLILAFAHNTVMKIHLKVENVLVSIFTKRIPVVNVFTKVQQYKEMERKVLIVMFH